MAIDKKTLWCPRQRKKWTYARGHRLPPECGVERGALRSSVSRWWPGEGRSAGRHRPFPGVCCGAWPPEARSMSPPWPGEGRSAGGRPPPPPEFGVELGPLRPGLAPLRGKKRAGLQDVIALPPEFGVERGPLRPFVSRWWPGQGRSSGGHHPSPRVCCGTRHPQARAGLHDNASDRPSLRQGCTC